MAMIEAQALEKLQRQHGAVYWKVYDPNGKTLINEVKSDIGIDASTEVLQEFIASCLGDFVIVKLYREKPEFGTAGKATDQGITLKVRLNNPGGIGRPDKGTSAGAPTFQDFLALMDAKRNVEMEKLRLELETTKNSITDRLIAALTENPAILSGVVNLLQSFSPAARRPAPAIGNTGAGIENTLNRLAAVDPDYINTLENLTAYLEKNPGVIDQIKPIFTPK